jgi:dTDP-4-dehydrorhamnose reductase
LGAALTRHLEQRHRIIPFRRGDLDILHPDRVPYALAAHDFRTVIYTAGITNVDECETHPREAALANTETPRALAGLCKAHGARFVHVSTDYVFDGQDSAPRNESDPAVPVNIYGRTKLEGERAVMAVSPDHLVIRVSWLFGPDKPSFPDSILQRAMKSDRVEAIADKHSTPTYTEDLASWIECLLHEPRASGVLHLCNSGAASWQSYGQAVLDLASEIGFKLRTPVVHPVLRRDFPEFKAERPEFTLLDTTRFQQLTGVTPRHWKKALEEYLRGYSSRCGAEPFGCL